MPLLVYANVGALDASRRPGNPIGWLLCIIGVVSAVLSFSASYGDYALQRHPEAALPGAVYTACISQSIVSLPNLIVAATLLVLLFSDGRLPDHGLRNVPWVVVCGGVPSALWALTAEEHYTRYLLLSPFWLESAPGNSVEAFGRLGAVALLVTLVVAIMAAFVRLGSMRVEERQQLDETRRLLEGVRAAPLGTHRAPARGIDAVIFTASPLKKIVGEVQRFAGERG